MSLFVLYATKWVVVFDNSTMLMPLGSTQPGLTHKHIEMYGRVLSAMATDPIIIVPQFFSR